LRSEAPAAIYSCARVCFRTFEQEPDPFIAGEGEHPLDEASPLPSGNLRLIFIVASHWKSTLDALQDEGRTSH